MLDEEILKFIGQYTIHDQFIEVLLMIENFIESKLITISTFYLYNYNF